MIRRLALVVVALVAVGLALGRGAALSLVAVAAIFVWKRQRNRGPRLFPQWMRQAILARDGGRCQYCGVEIHYLANCPERGCDDCYQTDHEEAWADGGDTTIRNGRAACRWCNLTKGALSVDEFADAVRRRAEGLKR